MPWVIVVEEISCDRCGYYDDESKFPDAYSEKGREVLKKFDVDLDDPLDLGFLQGAYAGPEQFAPNVEIFLTLILTQIIKGCKGNSTGNLLSHQSKTGG